MICYICFCQFLCKNAGTENPNHGMTLQCNGSYKMTEEPFSACQNACQWPYYYEKYDAEECGIVVPWKPEITQQLKLTYDTGPLVRLGTDRHARAPAGLSLASWRHGKLQCCCCSLLWFGRKKTNAVTPVHTFRISFHFPQKYFEENPHQLPKTLNSSQQVFKNPNSKTQTYKL